MRKSTVFFIALGGIFFLVLLTIGDSIRQQQAATGKLERESLLVQELGLTDLALSSEARYTRHLSQADRHAAFQDHPMALEHFPGGSLFFPPRHLQP